MKQLQSFGYFLNQWLQRRWQPLLFLFGAYLPLAVFAVLAIQIWQLEGGLGWDVSILTAIHATASAPLDQFARIWTRLGTKWGVFPATAIIGIGLFYLRRWRWLTFWLITLLGCALINRTAKLWLHRVRPSLWDHLPEAEFSFPSGHAMASMGFVMALVILTWNSRYRVWVWLAGGLFALSIAWTRLYLGVHYPSDILAGWMMAIAWAVGVSLLVKPVQPPAVVTRVTRMAEVAGAIAAEVTGEVTGPEATETETATRTPPHSSDSAAR